MGVALHVYKLDPNNTVTVKHVFYGRNESHAQQLMREHGLACGAFGPALAEGRTVERVVLDVDPPDADLLDDPDFDPEIDDLDDGDEADDAEEEGEGEDE